MFQVTTVSVIVFIGTNFIYLIARRKNLETNCNFLSAQIISLSDRNFFN